MRFLTKKILIVTPDFPYPPNHGGRYDIWNRIIAISELGYNIDLISTVNEFPDEKDLDYVKKYVNKINCVLRSRSVKENLSLLPFQIKSRDLKNISITESEYDILILESEYVYSILYNPFIKAKKCIIRIHNDEKIYFKELFRSEKLCYKKIFYFLEAIKFNFMEKKLYRHIKNIMYISYDDYKYFCNKYKSHNIIWLPPAVELEFKHRNLCNISERRVLFIGSLFMINNQEAIKWYLSNVHGRLLDIEGYEFIIAGNTRGRKYKWLVDIVKNNKKISFIESPKDLETIYSGCNVFVNPMLHGAGVKIKTLDALINGLPVVSTTIGNQGTGLENKKHLYVTDNPILFSDYIRELLLNPSVGMNMVNCAHEFLREMYNQKKILSEYLSEL